MATVLFGFYMHSAISYLFLIIQLHALSEINIKLALNLFMTV